MKTTIKISKSNVMKRAWRIYRSTSDYSYSFSASLKRAWQIEKENAMPKVVETVETVEQDCNYDINMIMSRMDDLISSDYSSGMNRYYGD